MNAYRDLATDFSTKSSTAPGIRTPSPSEDSLPDYDYYSASPMSKETTPKETVPCPGNTYIIRDPILGRQITIERGELCLKDHAGEQGGYHWVCVENDGWLGFYDPIHGMYMGRDNRGGYRAKARNHQGWEHFCVRRHPDGGYLLLTRHWDSLMKMETDENTTKLIETSGEGKGTAWEFVKV